MKSIDNFINEKLTFCHHVNEKLTLNKQSQILERTPKDWTIEKAKDGDIITDVRKMDNTKSIYIFKKIKRMSKLKIKMIMAYCFYNFDKKIFSLLNDNRGWCSLDGYDGKHFDYWLSTETEKREFFNAIKNEGYEWDPIKKEIKKI